MIKLDSEFTQNTLIEHSAEDGDIYQTISGDITKLIQDNKNRRNAESDYRPFLNKDYVMAADIDNVTGMDILNRFGINVWGSGFDWKELYKILKEHYPYTLCSRARLA